MNAASPLHRDRVAVVINGNAKEVTSELVDVLDQIIASGDLFVSRSLEEGHAIAQQIVERGYPTVLTGGGDGTFSQMVTWIVHACQAEGRPWPRFGLLRLGTGNALAWVLGAQKSRRGVVADIARLRTEGGHRDLRLLEVRRDAPPGGSAGAPAEDTESEGVLAPFAGIGVDALALGHFHEVRDRMRKIPFMRRIGTGELSYFLAIAGKTLPAVLVKPHVHARVINTGAPAFRIGPNGQPEGRPIEAGEVLYEGKARAVTFSSIPYWGFGSRIFPFADDREDRFNLRIVNLESLDVALHIRAIWNGTYRTPRLIDYLVDAVRIESDEDLPVQIGGDAAGTSRIVNARLFPEPIPVVDYYAPPRV